MAMEDYLTGNIKQGICLYTFVHGVRNRPVRRGHLIALWSKVVDQGGEDGEPTLIAPREKPLEYSWTKNN